MRITGTKFVVVPLWLIKAEGGRPLKSTTLLTWCWLQHHMNRATGLCFPSLDTLAEEIGCSKRSVNLAIKNLVELGAVKVERRGPKSSMYRLVYEQKEAQKTALLFQKETQICAKRSEVDCTSFEPIPIIINKRNNKRKLITRRARSLATRAGATQNCTSFCVDDLLEIYNSEFLKVKAPEKKPRKCSKGSATYKKLKARIKERPDRETWVALFQRAAKSPWCLGKVPKCPEGMDLDNFSGAGFLDKLEAGKYDPKAQGIDIDSTWAEKERLAGVMTRMRTGIRYFLDQKLKAKESPSRWYQGWLEQLIIDLKAEDAITLEGRCVHFCKDYWNKITRVNNEQTNTNHQNARDVQPKGGRSDAEKLPFSDRDLFG